MKRLVNVLIILGIGYVSIASPAQPTTLTSVYTVHALTNSEAQKALPVALEATVTYYRASEHTLFVQDGSTAVFIMYPSDAKVNAGDRIRVLGKTKDSFTPIVAADSITIIGRQSLPHPVPANFDQLIRAQDDCKLVTVRGVIRSANFYSTVHFANLQLLAEGGYFDATIDGDDARSVESLLDAEVEITGVASEHFDSKMQVTGILLHLQNMSGIQVLNRANKDPWALPLTPMDQILGVYRVTDHTPRVRIHGVITYYEPGAAVILQDGVKSTWIETEAQSPLQIGNIADAVGFPAVHDGFLSLLHGEIHDDHHQAPIIPLPATWSSLTTNSTHQLGHHFDLVSIEGKVISQVQESSQDEYVLSADGKLFSAIYRHLFGLPPSFKQLPIGAKVRVTGICDLENSNPFIPEIPFNILMRSPSDIVVIANPSLLNVRNLVLVVGLLFVFVLAAIARSYSLERNVRRHTTAFADLVKAEADFERRRARILEDINGSRPLAEILEEITALAAFKLNNAHTWCKLTDGACFGDCSSVPDPSRVLQQPIFTRSGPPFGFFYSAIKSAPQPNLELETQSTASRQEALATAAGLASLAIETRRLYVDLRHRSEFDLLTDTQNRFSLNRHLQSLIEEAHKNSTSFGLIYIDLDKFKQVNDQFGHQTGDIYLQHVALRMKHQLRACDMLARLGGDEFAVLTPEVRTRQDVEEIAYRLSRAFDEPFTGEGFHLRGSASIGIALYPIDGLSGEELLQTADAAMYKAKKTRSDHLVSVHPLIQPEFPSQTQA